MSYYIVMKPSFPLNLIDFLSEMHELIERLFKYLK